MHGSRPAGSGSVGDGMVKTRLNAADSGEAVDSDERRVINHSGSLYVNIPFFTRKLHGIDVGDGVVVETYRDCIKIVPEEVADSESEQ